MKMKLLSLLLILVLVVGVGTLTAMAEETHTNHCVCGGTCDGVGDHSCADSGVIENWTPFSESVLEYDSETKTYSLPTGNYYLTGQTVITGKSLTIMPGAEVTFCLHGQEMTTSSRMFKVNGTLNITNCQESGKLISNTTNAPVIYTYSGGHVNLFGGTLTAKSGVDRNFGGVIGMSKDAGNASAQGSSSMTMYGGTIDASKLTIVKTASGGNGSGGAIFINGNSTYPATFIQYGGTIKAAKSVESNGAAIAASAGNIIKILDQAVVTSGEAGGYGDGIYAVKGATVVVGGNVQVDDVYVPGNTSISVQNLTGSVGISAARTNEGVIAICDSAESAANLVSKVPGSPLAVTEASGKYQVNLIKHVDHCACGGNLTGVAAQKHTCSATAPTWVSVTNENIARGAGLTVASDRQTNSIYNMFVESGYYLLTEDIELERNFEIRPGQNITICLNGYTVTTTQAQTIFRITGGTLNICDCSNQGVVTSTLAETAPVVYLLNGVANATEGCTFNLYGGNLTGDSTNAGANGGIIQLANSSSTTPAVMNMYGGTITGTSRKNGGSISMVNSSAAVLNIYGGTVQGGDAAVGGGNIRCSAGNMYIFGGTVRNGTAVTGGNIYIGAKSSCTISGGLIDGGVVTEKGGSIYNEGTLTVTGGEIRNATETATAQTGGVIYTIGSMSISGATISGGNASKSPSGGGIAVAGGSTATISDSVLNAGWGVRGGIINVCGTDTVLTITDSQLNGFTEENPYMSNGEPKTGNAIWVEQNGRLNLVGNVVMTGDGDDLICGDYRKFASPTIPDGCPDTIIDVSLLDTQEPISLRRQNGKSGKAVYAGDNDKVILEVPTTKVVEYNAEDQYYYVYNLTVYGYDAQGDLLFKAKTLEEALATEAACYQVREALDGLTITRSITLDLHGYAFTNAIIPADVTVSIVDTSTDKYESGAAGSLSGTIEGTVNALTSYNKNKYLVVNQDGAYSAHHYQVLLTHLTLRPAADALGYKARLMGDDVVFSQVTGYGFYLGVEGSQLKHSMKDGAPEDGIFTLRLQNVLAQGGGETPITGYPVIYFGELACTADPYTATMKHAIENINATWLKRPQTQQDAVKALCDANYDAVSKWNLFNIYLAEDDGGIKNIILIIGDGMGNEQIRAGEFASGRTFVFRDWENTYSNTNSLRVATGLPEQTTDSAAGGTALATGYLTNNDRVGVDPDDQDLKTILDWAKEYGKDTGVLTTDVMNGATPGAFSAHTNNRHDKSAILNSQLTSGVDLLCANASDLAKSMKADIEDSGYTYCTDLDQAQASMDQDMVYWLLNMERTNSNSLELETVVPYALDYLDQNEEGFVIMIEQAFIDKFCHDWDIEGTEHYSNSLNNTVQVVMDWIGDRNDTAVIITADHETGGLSVGQEGEYANSYTSAYGNTFSYEYTTESHSSTLVPVYWHGFDVDLTPYFLNEEKTIIKNISVFDIMMNLLV